MLSKNIALYLFTMFLAAACAKSEDGDAGSSKDCGNLGRIVYNANGATSGSVPAEQCVGAGSIFWVGGNDGNLARIGFVFGGWNSKSDGTGTTYAGSYQALNNGTLTLFAKWTPAYSVTYDGNGNTGGAPPTDAANYTQGSTVTTLRNTGGLTKTGLAFAGWNLLANGAGTNYINGASFLMGSGNVTLYAKWGTPYTITYDGNGNTSGTAPIDNNVYATTIQFQLLDNTGGMTKTGVEFLGWNTQANGLGTDYGPTAMFTMGATNVTLFAKWGLRNRSWRAIASSGDGLKLAATVNSIGTGRIYTSIDGGITWVVRGPAMSWTTIASSVDGTRLIAAPSGGQLHISGDSGATWTPYGPSLSWRAVASSDDGTKLAAVAPSNQIYTSTDSGVTWTARESSRNWFGIASSADGTRLAAVVSSGQIYISADSGVTWTPRETARGWRWIASSSDGTKLAAVTYIGRIYTSADSGVTWTAREGTRWWQSISSSADGMKLVAVEEYQASEPGSGRIYTSADAGVTWTARDSARRWMSVTSSQNGANVAAVVADGWLYISNDSGATWTPKF